MPATQPIPIPGPSLVPQPDDTPAYTFPLPPLDQHFNTAEEGRKAINTFAAPHGWAVTSIRSKATKKGVKKTIRLICDRGHAVKADKNGPGLANDDSPGPAKKRRKTTTLALGCPFKMALRLDLKTDLWGITLEHATHNHPSSHASTHPIHRALELTQRNAEVDNAIQQGHTTSQILTEIREADPETILVPRDIHNRRRKLDQMFLDGCTPLQALLQELPKDVEWVLRHRRLSQGESINPP
ncbi:uncharacterized protein N7515_004301 [Penicillium bovifimosum]|uniref:FAR1 domain-containing protein n=1 Tax=Penicillium bovifimosum TaxID=126998 RepID=A0A9W9H177_9EURO|nr:uncharacterized protein N7515_004301 [Penicillium bovifimosum]KAJ5135023.1 hypothetical protein N7515_004301 [Penicillium bovifimosum]